MIKIDYLRCDLCGACLSVCPEDCMALDETRLNINKEICSKCKLCVGVCPFGALSLITVEEQINEKQL